MPPESAPDDPAFARLLSAVALGEGFQFHLVTAHGPRQVRALLNHLVAKLPAQRGGAVRDVYLAPYAILPRERALDADALIAHIDTALATLRSAAGDERLIVALDATPAGEEDDAAWRRVFRHMNEQRNGFIRQLDAAFLLCLPPGLQAPFAHEAADFWSIRSVSVTLAPEAATAGDASRSLERHDRAIAPLRPPPTAADLETARTEAAEAPQNEWRQRRLMALLQRQGDDALHRQGDSVAALTVYREALAIGTAIAERDPANTEWQRDLIVSNVKIGEACGEKSYFERALSIAETLQSRDALRPSDAWVLADLKRRIEQ